MSTNGTELFLLMLLFLPMLLLLLLLVIFDRGGSVGMDPENVVDNGLFAEENCAVDPTLDPCISTGELVFDWAGDCT